MGKYEEDIIDRLRNEHELDLTDIKNATDLNNALNKTTSLEGVRADSAIASEQQKARVRNLQSLSLFDDERISNLADVNKEEDLINLGEIDVPSDFDDNLIKEIRQAKITEKLLEINVRGEDITREELEEIKNVFTQDELKQAGIKKKDIDFSIGSKRRFELVEEFESQIESANTETQLNAVKDRITDSELFDLKGGTIQANQLILNIDEKIGG